MLRKSRWIAAVLSLLTAFPLTARAAQSPQAVVDSADLDFAIAQQVRQADQDRATIQRLLARDEVRKMAAEAGIDLRRSSAAVATLEGEQLQRIAAQAATADAALAGGKTNVNFFMIFIVLLVIAAAVVAAVASNSSK